MKKILFLLVLMMISLTISSRGFSGGRCRSFSTRSFSHTSHSYSSSRSFSTPRTTSYSRSSVRVSSPSSSSFRIFSRSKTSFSRPLVNVSSPIKSSNRTIRLSSKPNYGMTHTYTSKPMLKKMSKESRYTPIRKNHVYDYHRPSYHYGYSQPVYHQNYNNGSYLNSSTDFLIQYWIWNSILNSNTQHQKVFVDTVYVDKNKNW